MIKAVIFDIDGTMYDYDGCHRIAMGRLEEYCREHFALEPEDTRKYLKEANRVMVERMGNKGASVHNRLIRFQCMLELLGQPVFPHARTMYHVYWDTMLELMTPFDGLADWMGQLKAEGLQVGVGSNMTAYMQYKKLEKLELTPFIDWLVTSEEAGAEKPDGRIFEQCIAKSGLKPEECLFVGDSLRADVEGARAAGMHALLFAPGLDARKDVQADGKERISYRVIRSYRECLAEGFCALK